MQKIPLTDTTFIIPFTIEHEHRLENLNCILKFLHEHFDTNFILVESGQKSRFFELEWVGAKHIFNVTEPGEFHRTKQINIGIKEAKTPFISIYDADVIFDPINILKAVEVLRNGATLSYPYSGKFVDIERSYITDGIIKERESFASESVGGACFLNREEYIKCGMELEFFRGHCPDDVERFGRVQKLGYRVEQIEGTCWHINHFRGENSGPSKHTEANLKEWFKCRDMSREELLSYIKTWSWAK